jgi:hypothetical protein
MTAVGLPLRAKQGCSDIEEIWGEQRWDPSIMEQPVIGGGIRLPLKLSLFVRAKQVFRRSQLEFVSVFSSRQFPKEELKIGLLREAGQLRSVVESRIQNALDGSLV